MKYPNQIFVEQLRLERWQSARLLDSGYWVAARPDGFASPWQRLRLAWAVFTGEADALYWEGQ